MKSPVENLVDYLEYRKICGDKAVDLEPGSAAALASLAAKTGGVSRLAEPPARGITGQEGRIAPPPSVAPGGGSPERLAPPATAPQTAAACDFLFVGEQEGIDADRAAYSETMRKMVAAMGYGKGQAVFTNICVGRKAASPPSDAEMAAAMPAFKDIVAKARPRGIVVLGGVAARGLLGLPDIFAAHGRTFRFDGIPAIPTYHPAYMVKFPEVKRDACRDLCNALKAIGRPVPQALAPFQ